MSERNLRKSRWPQLPLACPYCGNHGDGGAEWTKHAAVPFKLVEDVVRSFEFHAAIEDGVLSLVADVNTDSVDWESGSNLRIACMQCFEDFDLPDGAAVDFD